MPILDKAAVLQSLRQPDARFGQVAEQLFESKLPPQEVSELVIEACPSVEGRRQLVASAVADLAPLVRLLYSPGERDFDLLREIFSSDLVGRVAFQTLFSSPPYPAAQNSTSYKFARFLGALRLANPESGWTSEAICELMGCFCPGTSQLRSLFPTGTALTAVLCRLPSTGDIDSAKRARTVVELIFGDVYRVQEIMRNIKELSDFCKYLYPANPAAQYRYMREMFPNTPEGNLALRSLVGDVEGLVHLFELLRPEFGNMMDFLRGFYFFSRHTIRDGESIGVDDAEKLRKLITRFEDLKRLLTVSPSANDARLTILVATYKADHRKVDRDAHVADLRRLFKGGTYNVRDLMQLLDLDPSVECEAARWIYSSGDPALGCSVLTKEEITAMFSTANSPEDLRYFVGYLTPKERQEYFGRNYSQLVFRLRQLNLLPEMTHKLVCLTFPDPYAAWRTDSTVDIDSFADLTWSLVDRITKKLPDGSWPCFNVSSSAAIARLWQDIFKSQASAAQVARVADEEAGLDGSVHAVQVEERFFFLVQLLEQLHLYPTVGEEGAKFLCRMIDHEGGANEKLRALLFVASLPRNQSQNLSTWVEVVFSEDSHGVALRAIIGEDGTAPQRQGVQNIGLVERLDEICRDREASCSMSSP